MYVLSLRRDTAKCGMLIQDVVRMCGGGGGGGGGNHGGQVRKCRSAAAANFNSSSNVV